MNNPVDPETGTPLHRDVRPFTLTYKGESITIDMPGWYGDQPDEGIFAAEDMKISDRALNRLKARSDGLLEPEEIKRIRKKLKLTQETAGKVIGGGSRAFQKYETGDLLPSRAISSALVLLDRDPPALSALTERQARSHDLKHHASHP
jgi:HTH-type transcriptional regulator/antitoxin MqsA